MKLKDYFILQVRGNKRHPSLNLKKDKSQKIGNFLIFPKGKRGMGVVLIVALAFGAVLITLIGALIYALVNHVDVSSMFDSATLFFNTIKFWILGIIIFIFLWTIGFLKWFRKIIFKV